MNLRISSYKSVGNIELKTQIKAIELLLSLDGHKDKVLPILEETLACEKKDVVIHVLKEGLLELEGVQNSVSQNSSETKV